MPTGTIKAGNTQVFVDGRSLGYCQLTAERELPDDESLVVNFQTEYTVEVEVLPMTDWDSMRKALGVQQPQTTAVTYRPGQQWFQPTLTIMDAVIQPWKQHEKDEMIVVEFEACAQGCDVQWANVWARPIYWLWRLWTKTKAFVRKFLGTEQKG
jgi:hypothetical protein